MDPKLNPLTVVVGFPVEMIVPVPDITDQSPVPTVGVFAVIIAELEHTVWLGPAMAVVAIVYTITEIVEVDGGHTPLVIVH